MNAVLPLLGIFAFVAFGYALFDANRSVAAEISATDRSKRSLIS